MTDARPRTRIEDFAAAIVANIEAHRDRAEAAAAASLERSLINDGPEASSAAAAAPARAAALWAALEACGLRRTSTPVSKDAVAAWGAGDAAMIVEGDIAEYLAWREDVDLYAVAADLDARWRDHSMATRPQWGDGTPRTPGLRMISGSTWPARDVARDGEGPFFYQTSITAAAIAGAALALWFGPAALVAADAPPEAIAALLYHHVLGIGSLWEAEARAERLHADNDADITEGE